MTADPKRPYNDLPLLPPQSEVETKRVMRACASARAAVAELRLAGLLIPDQSVLINTIPLLEAKDSSEIENIVTTNDALFRQAGEYGEDEDPKTREALRYRSALMSGFHALKDLPLTARTAREVCQAIKGIEMDVRKTPGTALRNSHTGDVIYMPPEGVDLLNRLLSNWERYLHDESEIDPLVRMAVLHYQFEAIHPFPDGNGRTGRILNILLLIEAGLLDAPTLYLSRHILRTRGEYYARLQQVTEAGEWEAWIVYMLTAVQATASWTNQRIRAIRDLMNATTEHIKASAPKIYTHELVEIIFARPYCRIGHLVERGIAQRVAASRYLKQLVAIGVLREEKSGRDKIYIHEKFMDLLGRDDHGFARYGA